VDVIAGTNIHPWTADTVWHLIKAIHDGFPPYSAKCPVPETSGKLVDDFSNIGINLKGGSWIAFSDYWSRTSAEQAHSTKVLTPDKTFDLALQYGSYGDITPGYFEDPNTGYGLKSIIKTFSKVGTAAAEGGFTMNFLPVDRSIDTTAQSWEIAKIGVERNLAAYKKLVVGAQCSTGKQIRIFLRTKVQLEAYSAGYGNYFSCTGTYMDYELPFALLQPIWGSSPIGFDASHSLQITIEFVDPAPPNELTLNITGIALDTSVLSFKNIIATEYKSARQENPCYQQRLDGIYFNSTDESNLEIYTMDGKLIQNLSLRTDHFNWGPS
jgi:hypothetical protein